MGAAVTTTGEYIFGNIHDEALHFPDLISGPRDSTRAFRMEPGQVIDLEDYFTAVKLRRSHSVKQALEAKWLKRCKTTSETIVPNKRKYESGIAPINDFDEKLADLLDKEEKEEEALKSGRDPLGARARRVREAKKQ